MYMSDENRFFAFSSYRVIFMATMDRPSMVSYICIFTASPFRLSFSLGIVQGRRLCYFLHLFNSLMMFDTHFHWIGRRSRCRSEFARWWWCDAVTFCRITWTFGSRAMVTQSRCKAIARQIWQKSHQRCSRKSTSRGWWRYLDIPVFDVLFIFC